MDDQITDGAGSGILKAFGRGAWRGIKFGAMAGMTIWLIIIGVCLNAAFLIHGLRDDMLADLHKRGVLPAIGGLLAPFLLMAFYGVVPGALIMGFAELRRARKAKPPESENTFPLTSDLIERASQT
jgi:hypothetical protein